MFGAARGAACTATRSVGKRFYSAHHDHPTPPHTEIDLTKVFGFALLGGATLYLYRSSKEPVVKTAMYNTAEERSQLRNEDYLAKYKISSVKNFILDKGGIGQRRFSNRHSDLIPQTVIPTHSPFGDQFGAGIKTSQLGPRRERIRYFAPLDNWGKDTWRWILVFTNSLWRLQWRARIY